MARKQYTKAEKRSFKKGMQAQYSKEHPLMKYKVSADVIYMNNKNKVDYQMKDVKMGSSYHKTKKSALAALKKAKEGERFQKAQVLRKAKAGTLDMHNSQDCSYYEYNIIPCNKRL